MTESQNTPDPGTNPETAAPTPPPESADAATGATPTEAGAPGGADPAPAVPVSSSGTSGGADTAPATGALPPTDPDITLESPGAPTGGAWGTADGPAVPAPSTDGGATGVADGPAAPSADAATAGAATAPPSHEPPAGALPTDPSAPADAATGAAADASGAPADGAAATTAADGSASPVDTGTAGTTPADASTAPVDTAGTTPADSAPVDAASPADTSAAADASAAPAAAGAAAGTGMTGEVPPAAPGGPLKSDRIQLVSESGQALTVGVRTPLGKHMVRQFGDDSNVWDPEQCTLERGPDGTWQILPAAGTTNETLLNGAPITSAQPLHEGDVIAVGRAAKGIVKLPLTARAG